RDASPSTAASEALPKGGEGPGRANLGDRSHRTDVDAELQRRGGHRGRRQIAVLEAGLKLLSKALGQAAVVGKELVRHTAALAPTPQAVCHGLYPPAGTRKEEVVAAAQTVEDVVGDQVQCPLFAAVC